MTQNIPRRDVLRSAGAAGAAVAGAGALAACGSSTSSTPSTGATAAAGSATSAGTTTAASPAAGTTVAKADVPVGGGKVSGQIVVTQPTAGSYTAFSAVCPHQGCLVSGVSGGRITCACHGSAFDATSGAVTAGPAKSGLTPKKVSESGSNLVVS